MKISKRFAGLCLTLIIASTAFAQTETVPEPDQPVANEQNAQLAEKTVDSLSKAEAVVPEPKKRSWRKKLVWASDTLTTSDYMMSIERINDKLNDIRDSAKLGVEVITLARRIDNYTQDINQVRKYAETKTSGVHIKNIDLYHSYLSSLYDQNQRAQSNLKQLYNQLYHAKLRLKGAMSDSVFKALCADSSLRWKFSPMMDRLQTKWYNTDKLTREGLRTLNFLKVNASENSISLSNMLISLENRRDKVSDKLFGEEVNYLWKPSPTVKHVKNESTQLSKTLDNEFNAIKYYLFETLQWRILMLIIALCLFGWLYRIRDLLKEERENNRKLAFLHLQYLNTKPIPALVAVILLMMQLFDAYAPTSYLAIEHLALLTAVSLIFREKWHRELLTEWKYLLGISIAIIITNLLIESSFLTRFWLLLLYGGLIVSISRFIKKTDSNTAFYRWMRIAATTSILLAVLGIVSNLVGRFSLACILGVASVFSILQAVALPVLFATVQEIIFLHIENRRLRKGINRPFDHSIVIKKLKMPLTISILLLWFIILTSNLNVYPWVSERIESILTATRSVGNVSFQLINILLFFAIIWLAHLLQRLISFAFGAIGSDLDDITEVSKGQHSRLLMIRLLVLCGGYLLAIAASGLPLDKITIVLGALSVGIGLGLQAIVNNFMSGIILIVDGSLQIGDDIEVSGQTGKVKEIGLRASTINTVDGAEVVIPNSILTSQNVVNWTSSNDQRRMMIEFSLSGSEMDANIINEVINNTLANMPNVIAKKKPVILFTKVTPDTCWLKVHFWSTISKMEQVKSDALLHLKKGFEAKGISME